MLLMHALTDLTLDLHCNHANSLLDPTTNKEDFTSGMRLHFTAVLNLAVSASS
eukprot:m.181570 g.181570  ORF g.181570 m.181570 type:complete len:53 (+) comp53471_c0_seq3:1260-1418(+)